MIPDPDSLRQPDSDTPAELLRWRPEHGVLSLYVRIDPGDRSEKWRTEMRNGLSVATGSADTDDEDLRAALEATVGRIQRELLDEERRGEHRGLIGFVEVGAKEGEERWFGTQIPPRRAEVAHAPVARIHQLLELLDDGAPLGVAAVSSERVRLLDWRLGRTEHLHDWELEYFGDDWKERKAERPPDPARVQGVSASGRDQYDQRLEANRERFAEETGGLARGEARKRGWSRTVVFGDRRYASKFSSGFADEVVQAEQVDLVTEPSSQIGRRIEQLIPRLNRDREAALIERVKEAAYAEGRSALGLQETLQALGEGRVEHLVYDASRDYPEVGFESAEVGEDGLPLIERMIEMALSTGAAVTPVEGESAQALSEQDGVAALLRY